MQRKTAHNLFVYKHTQNTAPPGYKKNSLIWLENIQTHYCNV